MRIVAFIMAMLVLGLSFVPCRDTADPLVKEVVKHKLSATMPDDDAHDDSCSPFCHCACCAGVSLEHGIAAVQQLLPPLVITHNARYIESIREISIPVWQPPQLG